MTKESFDIFLKDASNTVSSWPVWKQQLLDSKHSNVRILKLCSVFSKTPGSRLAKEGKYSGEEFRDNILTPMLQECIKNDTMLLVDLDGGSGYACCFLEEAFGGLIRLKDIALTDMQKHLNFISNEDPDLINEIKGYILEAHMYLFEVEETHEGC